MEYSQLFEKVACNEACEFCSLTHLALSFPANSGPIKRMNLALYELHILCQKQSRSSYSNSRSLFLHSLRHLLSCLRLSTSKSPPFHSSSQVSNSSICRSRTLFVSSTAAAWRSVIPPSVEISAALNIDISTNDDKTQRRMRKGGFELEKPCSVQFTRTSWRRSVLPTAS
ncbi:hypothetical protein BDV12DRAFT_49461 [Aspergillus spectabilis]